MLSNSESLLKFCGLVQGFRTFGLLYIEYGVNLQAN